MRQLETTAGPNTHLAAARFHMRAGKRFGKTKHRFFQPVRSAGGTDDGGESPGSPGPRGSTDAPVDSSTAVA